MFRKSPKEQLLNCAKAFKGKLQWVADNKDYFSFDDDSTIPNDFRLLFDDSLGNVPQNIRATIQEKNAQILKGEPCHSPLNMCCWEFCFLSFVNAGLISKEEMKNILAICTAKNCTMVDSLYGSDTIQSNKIASLTNLPLPGDVVLVVKELESGTLIPSHAAICINTHGDVMENNEERNCDKNNVSHYLMTNNSDDIKVKCYIIPFQKIISNIQIFIKTMPFISTMKEKSNLSKIF